MDNTTLTDITEQRLRECANEAAASVGLVEFRQRLDMGHGIWQLWLALVGKIDKPAARRDMDRLYALIEPENVTGVRPLKHAESDYDRH